VVELAAGDGTLSRFLNAAGLAIQASDDYSWDATAKMASADVVKLDAITALKKLKPGVIICSWPPAANSFEREIFAASETQLYVVVGSRHHFASGDRSTYSTAVGTAEQPGKFTVEFSKRLTEAVLPRELDNEVLVFRRR